MEYPRPQQIAPGVQWFAARTPTLPPATHTNSYAIGERDIVLIEPATPHDDERRAWIAWARGLESAGANLVAIFATHHHIDHVSGASFFSSELDLPLWGHAGTAELLPDLSFSRLLEADESIVLEGPTPQRWQCMLTPGHAPGHLCLHSADLDMIIVGDMVASEGTILIAPGEGDLAEYIRQLSRLADLEASVALPAHGAPIEAPRALFEHYVRHRLMREGKVVAALQAHLDGGDLDDLVAVAYDDTDPKIWPIAKLSLESHLLKLRDDGRAERCDAGWRPR